MYQTCKQLSEEERGGGKDRQGTNREGTERLSQVPRFLIAQEGSEEREFRFKTPCAVPVHPC